MQCCELHSPPRNSTRSLPGSQMRRAASPGASRSLHKAAQRWGNFSSKRRSKFQTHPRSCSVILPAAPRQKACSGFKLILAPGSRGARQCPREPLHGAGRQRQLPWVWAQHGEARSSLLVTAGGEAVTLFLKGTQNPCSFFFNYCRRRSSDAVCKGKTKPLLFFFLVTAGDEVVTLFTKRKPSPCSAQRGSAEGTGPPAPAAAF